MNDRKTPPALPGSGGSYTRQSGGKLRRTDGTAAAPGRGADATPPAEAAPAAGHPASGEKED